MSTGLLRIHATTVPEHWIDYNGHMTEGAYGWAFADASDALLLHAGFDEDYRAQRRGSFYTVETHIRFRRELRLGDEVAFEMQVLGADDKRLHLFTLLLHGGAVAATQEAMLLHVDLDSGRVAPMRPPVADRFAALAAEHATLPRPEAAGASIRPLPGPPPP